LTRYLFDDYLLRFHPKKNMYFDSRLPPCGFWAEEYHSVPDSLEPVTREKFDPLFCRINSGLRESHPEALTDPCLSREGRRASAPELALAGHRLSFHFVIRSLYCKERIPNRN
jgi:hypothetical protein